MNVTSLGRKVMCRYEVYMLQKQPYVIESWSQVLPGLETDPSCLWA